MKVAVNQTIYLPWKGFFDLIHDVDLFIFYDEVQYTSSDFRNRNRIKRVLGDTTWLTIPVGKHYTKMIDEIELIDHKWQLKHFDLIKTNYQGTTYYNKYIDFFRSIYLDKQWTSLSMLNKEIITVIAKEFLKIKTDFTDSRNYQSCGKGKEKLISLLESAGASIYYSGARAKNYITDEDFKANGIKVIWKEYMDEKGEVLYPNYPQTGEFNHFVSIIDLLFNTGDQAPYYIWGWREENDKFAR